MLPRIFLFRFRHILVSHQAVPLTFYSKIALMVLQLCNILCQVPRATFLLVFLFVCLFEGRTCVYFETRTCVYFN